jgi:membrane protease YdiL (CAAX protease family)
MAKEPMSGTPVLTSKVTNPKIMVITFVILTFLFSSVFWYLTSQTSLTAQNRTMLMVYTVGAMWGPALAAVVTRLVFQHNLRGFAIGMGRPVWLAMGIFIPVAVGLCMFGAAWLSGIAPFNYDKAVTIFSVAFVPVFLYGIVFNLFAAAGEEFGWRGFLVPELARFQGFTTVALISAAIWTAWHFPEILFGTYHGSGPVWYSLAVFIPSVMGAGVIFAWLRLMSGSVWVPVLFHGFWNYFIQQFYPTLTVTTPAGTMMLGEFGWFVAVIYVLLALLFWYFRDRLPKLPAEGV